MHRKFKSVLGTIFVAALPLFTTCLEPSMAAPTFQQAVANYNAGKYQQALGEFEQIKAVYPTNALLRYYMALTHQNLGHIGAAKEDYLWVSQHGDQKLAAMGGAGLAGLSKLRGGRSGGSTTIASASIPTPTASPSASNGSRKVKKVIEFYADW